MPLVKRRRDGPEGEPQPKRARTTSKKCYREFDKLGYQDDRFHSIFRSIPEHFESLCSLLTRHVGSLLNGAGGIICFGARNTGTVYGVEITRKEEDNLKVIIDDIFKKFKPIVKTTQYRVSFTAVTSSYRSELYVIEIRVQAGKHFELYEDFNHECYLRRGECPYGPLTPHEIKRHTVHQLRQKLKDEHSLGLLVQSPATRSKTRALLQAHAVLDKPLPAKKEANRKPSGSPYHLRSAKKEGKKESIVQAAPQTRMRLVRRGADVKSSVTKVPPDQKNIKKLKTPAETLRSHDVKASHLVSVVHKAPAQASQKKPTPKKLTPKKPTPKKNTPKATPTPKKSTRTPKKSTQISKTSKSPPRGSSKTQVPAVSSAARSQRQAAATAAVVTAPVKSCAPKPTSASADTQRVVRFQNTSHPLMNCIPPPHSQSTQRPQQRTLVKPSSAVTARMNCQRSHSNPPPRLPPPPPPPPSYLHHLPPRLPSSQAPFNAPPASSQAPYNAPLLTPFNAHHPPYHYSSSNYSYPFNCSSVVGGVTPYGYVHSGVEYNSYGPSHPSYVHYAPR